MGMQVYLAAKTPEEICDLFRQYMAAGDLEGLLSLYDAEAAFLNQASEVKHGHQQLASELGRLAQAKAQFQFKIVQIIRSGDTALMHTEWKVLSPEPMRVYAIEVARRGADGRWRWLIGDPFTVSRYMRFSDIKEA